MKELRSYEGRYSDGWPQAIHLLFGGGKERDDRTNDIHTTWSERSGDPGGIKMVGTVVSAAFGWIGGADDRK